jgi:hypothetical protein
MADEADMSDLRIQLGIDQAIAQARSAPYLKPNGKCYSCEECVPDKLRFCGPQCRDDYQEADDQLKRLGR